MPYSSVWNHEMSTFSLWRIFFLCLSLGFINVCQFSMFWRNSSVGSCQHTPLNTQLHSSVWVLGHDPHVFGKPHKRAVCLYLSEKLQQEKDLCTINYRLLQQLKGILGLFKCSLHFSKRGQLTEVWWDLQTSPNVYR